jgi:hypothetical protein
MEIPKEPETLQDRFQKALQIVQSTRHAKVLEGATCKPNEKFCMKKEGEHWVLSVPKEAETSQILMVLHLALTNILKRDPEERDMDGQKLQTLSQEVKPANVHLAKMLERVQDMRENAEGSTEEDQQEDIDSPDTLVNPTDIEGMCRELRETIQKEVWGKEQ